MRSIVLLSGGLDSCVNLKLAQAETEIVTAITFDYGQRAGWREVAAAKGMCDRLRIPHETVSLDWLAGITKTALVNSDRPLPRITADKLDDRTATEQSAKQVWVPNRNGVFLNIAASYAESNECELVVAGFNQEEALTFPDNSLAFVTATNEALKISTFTHPQVRSFTDDLNKTEIVRMGRELEAPLDLVWSCYDGADDPCWRCESCLRFKRALEAGDSWTWYQEQTGPAAAANSG